jgi:hypothetical protein
MESPYIETWDIASILTAWSNRTELHCSCAIHLVGIIFPFALSTTFQDPPVSLPGAYVGLFSDT